ncbi:PLD nuclease N-terminal domain-containing protein [Avrilella dinanensis]|uniref:PLD nuclease N-terminal domain-containing protein n=1 Tax=Avrilella dinanensis TaxID=2008672 RepID=UPI0024090740|nr:PLD nuclease N-terminal domain-containing protein [Avrilella dinanensis]
MFGLSALDVLLLLLVYVLFVATSLVLLLKNEQGKSKFLWLLMILFFPFFGAVMYLSYYFLNVRKVAISNERP